MTDSNLIECRCEVDGTGASYGDGRYTLQMRAGAFYMVEENIFAILSRKGKIILSLNAPPHLIHKPWIVDGKAVWKKG